MLPLPLPLPHFNRLAPHFSLPGFLWCPLFFDRPSAGPSKKRSLARGAAEPEAEGSGGTNSTVAWQPAAAAGGAPSAPDSMASLDPSVVALLHMPLPQMLAAKLEAPAQQCGLPEGSSPKRARRDTAGTAAMAAGAAAMEMVAPVASRGQDSPSGSGAPGSAAGPALLRSGSSGALLRPQPVRPQPLQLAAHSPSARQQGPAAAAGQGGSIAERLAALLKTVLPPQQPAAAAVASAAALVAAVLPPAALLAPLAAAEPAAAAAAPALGQALAAAAASSAARPPALALLPQQGQQAKEEEAQAAVAALTDSLTGAVNRELLHTAVALQARVKELEAQLAAERAELEREHAQRARRAQRAAHLIVSAGSRVAIVAG